MLMIKAIVRPEKADEVMAELLLAGFPSISKMDLLGRETEGYPGRNQPLQSNFEEAAHDCH